MTNKIEIEIDGKTVEAEQGQMIIEVADQENIAIPRFCYHKKLSIAANCRMCLVDVEKSRKPLPACATPVTSGMVIRTHSKLALEAQKSVMEFLLINHPLDCPICDQGGQCELQDIALGYGRDVSRYNQGKRSVDDKNIGPLVATDMTRCIHCTRCVRFGREVAGMAEMGSIGRGEDTEISTYVEKSLSSELSANIIDLCPVGALTNKPFRYRARAWELLQTTGISPHDCTGTNLHLHTRRQQVMRVVPRENNDINETWIADRDRFSCEGLSSPDRVLQPLLKCKGQWQEVDWQTALHTAIDGIQSVISQHSAHHLGAVVSPNATLEEHYLLQKLMRGLGSHNIDHRLQQSDFHYQQHAPIYPGLEGSLVEIEAKDVIVIIGGDPRYEQPLINNRIRKAALAGAKVILINPLDIKLNFPASDKMICSNRQLPSMLAGICHHLSTTAEQIPEEAKALLATVTPTEQQQQIAACLAQGKSPLILLGAMAQNHQQGGLLTGLAQLMAHLSQAKLGTLTAGANTAGAWLAGAVPHRGPGGINVSKAGLDIRRMWESRLPAYLLMNVEPEFDCANTRQALDALDQAALVVCLTPYKTEAMEHYADVILPIAPFTETSGTFVNVEGRWQDFAAAVPAQGEARPGWKVLRVMGNLLGLDGFNYVASHEIREDIRELAAGLVAEQQVNGWRLPTQLPAVMTGIERITQWPIYRHDNIVRRALPLQQAAIAERPAVVMNAELAKRLALEEGAQVTVSQQEDSITLTVSLDERLPDETVYIAAGFAETAGLRESFGAVKLEGNE